MKYTVKVNGEIKEIEAAQFFNDGRMVVFAGVTPSAPANSMYPGAVWVPGKPQVFAAYQSDDVESIESDAVKEKAK